MHSLRASWVMRHGSWAVRLAFVSGILLLLMTHGPRLMTVFAEPTADELRGTIRSYIESQQAADGAFVIPDPLQAGKLRTLELVRVHERVGKTGNYYYSCTDMRDVASGDLLDLDFDISDTGDTLKVVAIRIHKDNGDPRYTYDDNDNLVPLR